MEHKLEGDSMLIIIDYTILEKFLEIAKQYSETLGRQ